MIIFTQISTILKSLYYFNEFPFEAVTRFMFFTLAKSMTVRGCLQKFIGCVRRSCATAMKRGVHYIQPYMILPALFCF